MKEKKKTRKKFMHRDVKILVVLIILLLALNYPILDDLLNKLLNTRQEVHVDRIIDGDTIESNRTSIRLLGINAPERGEFLYQESKDFLDNELLDQEATLEFIGDRYDKYHRLLAYVFLNNTNINVKMVENGFANYYFYSGKDKYSGALLDAWKTCIKNQINLCEPSDDMCASCININDINSIINTCSFSCDITGWQVRGEGREKFIFSEQIISPGSSLNFALDLSNTGNSLFLRDEEGKLVEWKI